MAYHFAHGKSVQHRSSIIRDVVQSGSLARIEPHTESPLLPFYQVTRYLERDALGLHNVQWLKISPQSILQEFWGIFCGLAMVYHPLGVGLVTQPVLLAPRSKPINPYNLPLSCIHDRDQRKRVSVEIGVRVAGSRVLRKAQSLEVTSVVLILIWTTIRPGLDDDLEALG